MPLPKAQLIDILPNHQLIEIKTISKNSSSLSSTREYHRHHCSQVVIVLNGTAQFLLNNVVCRVDKHSILMFGSNLAHGVLSVSAEASAMIIHIPHLLFSWAEGVGEMEREMLFLRESQFGFHFTHTGLHEKARLLCERMSQSSGFMRVGLLFELLSLLGDSGAQQTLLDNGSHASLPEPLFNDSAIDLVYRYLYLHFDQDITLEQVAQYANLHPSALCRAFKKRAGQTLFEFINRLRIERACQLLTSTNLTISQIAFRVGYNTFSYFSTRFVRRMKMSPSEYRKGCDAKVEIFG